MENIFNLKIIIRNIINIIGLTTPFNRLLVFIGGIVILWILPFDRLQYLPIRSVYETLFHVKPYSSGIMRGLSKLLHGDFYGAYEMNKLSYLVLLVVLFLIIKDILYVIRTKDFKI